MIIEDIQLTDNKDVRLTAFIQRISEDKGERITSFSQETEGLPDKHPAVIIIPGGGYSRLSERESDPIALKFAGMGYQAFILRYTVSETDKEHIWPHPIEEYDKAVEIIQSKADEWGVDTDRIAVCGFSAGAHLAACAATMADHRPAAVILGYPALLGDVCDACAPGLPHPIEEVDDQTPPCFIFMARDDMLVSVKNATAFADALTDHGINYEMHIYSQGGHGFTTALDYLNGNKISSRARNWIEDAGEFLEEVWGHFNINGFTSPEIQRTINGDYEKHLSVDCTLANLENQGPAITGLLKNYLAETDQLIEEKGFDGAPAQFIKHIYSFRTVLNMLSVPAEKISELNNRLSEIDPKNELHNVI